MKDASEGPSCRRTTCTVRASPPTRTDGFRTMNPAKAARWIPMEAPPAITARRVDTVTPRFARTLPMSSGARFYEGRRTLRGWAWTDTVTGTANPGGGGSPITVPVQALNRAASISGRPDERCRTVRATSP